MIGLLCSRSWSWWRFKTSLNVCQSYIYWTTDIFTTNLVCGYTIIWYLYNQLGVWISLQPTWCEGVQCATGSGDAVKHWRDHGRFRRRAAIRFSFSQFSNTPKSASRTHNYITAARATKKVHSHLNQIVPLDSNMENICISSISTNANFSNNY